MAVVYQIERRGARPRAKKFLASSENVASSNVANGQWGGLAGAEARRGFAGAEARRGFAGAEARRGFAGVEARHPDEARHPE